MRKYASWGIVREGLQLLGLLKIEEPQHTGCFKVKTVAIKCNYPYCHSSKPDTLLTHIYRLK